MQTCFEYWGDYSILHVRMQEEMGINTKELLEMPPKANSFLGIPNHFRSKHLHEERRGKRVPHLTKLFPKYGTLYSSRNSRSASEPLLQRRTKFPLAL
jgi:hypothetical protein